jgi:hypothetical protein
MLWGFATHPPDATAFHLSATPGPNSGFQENVVLIIGLGECRAVATRLKSKRAIATHRPHRDTRLSVVCLLLWLVISGPTKTYSGSQRRR